MDKKGRIDPTSLPIPGEKVVNFIFCFKQEENTLISLAHTSKMFGKQTVGKWSESMQGSDLLRAHVHTS